MPQPSRKTPNRIARVLELHKGGASSREIAEALGGLSHMTVTRWLADAGLKPNGGSGSRKSRRREHLNGFGGAMADAQRELAEMVSRPPPKDFADVLERMRKNFALAAAFVEFQFAQARNGKTTMTEVEKALRIQKQFAVEIRELTPKEDPNPDERPESAAAAELVMKKIMTTVQTSRMQARCAHCGKNPFSIRGDDAAGRHSRPGV